ncbi:MAG: type II toxin-antitoxin system HicA family toxin [Coriobacteriia bacterium]|nr:type II toxin-antitoxin system HicA family toxin [Coriobacteriia bacterium]
MKKRDLEKLFKQNGWVFDRHGGKHDIWKKGNDSEQIPRGREVNERLAKTMIKRWRLR